MRISAPCFRLQHTRAVWSTLRRSDITRGRVGVSSFQWREDTCGCLGPTHLNPHDWMPTTTPHIINFQYYFFIWCPPSYGDPLDVRSYRLCTPLYACYVVKTHTVDTKSRTKTAWVRKWSRASTPHRLPHEMILMFIQILRFILICMLILILILGTNIWNPSALQVNVKNKRKKHKKK